MNFDDMVDLDFDRLEVCPMCGHKTTYGEMIWLNGQCTCPACYMQKRAMLDADRGGDPDD